MKIFTPSTDTLLFFVLWTLAATAGAYFIHRLKLPVKKLLAWLWLVLATSVLIVQMEGEPAGFRMLGVIFIALVGMKGVVAAKSDVTLNVTQWLGFSLFWFGMKPRTFLTVFSKRKAGAGRMVFRGSIFASLGSLIIIGASFIPLNTLSGKFAATAFCFFGLSIFLHFGILRFAAGFWRNFGADTYDLFRSPLKSKSLTEFWGKRWNIAFSEMSNIAVFRPLKKNIGEATALITTFLFSGILHELAISFPVQAGYGLPTAYFLLHAFLVWLEKGKHIPWVFKNDFRARLWTFLWLVIPFPLVFHIYFVEGLVWPFLGEVSELVQLVLQDSFSINF